MKKFYDERTCIKNFSPVSDQTENFFEMFLTRLQHNIVVLLQDYILPFGTKRAILVEIYLMCHSTCSIV